jgi:5-methylcytosine-specific restriction endonuclease McrA
MSDMNDIKRWFVYGDENGDGPWNDDVDPDYEVGICQNCDVSLSLQQMLHRSLYCSKKCQQTAETVRYARRTLRDGRYERDPLVRQVIDERIAHIMGGGYPKKARFLTREQREAIFERDSRRCRLCGAPATEIDHIAGSSPDPDNLQALCSPCHHAKTGSTLRPATPEEAVEGKAIWTRITARRPIRLCDDEKNWDEIRKILAREQRTWALW